MLPNLNEVKTRRKQLGLTQSELARSANVSQSLIAKIEAGKLIPTYANAKQVFDVLNSLAESREVKVTAKDIMTRKIYSVYPSDSVKKAVKIMESKAISQLPVLDKGRQVGRVSEKNVLAKLGKSSDAVDLGELNVSALMEDCLPMVPESAPLEMLSELLKHDQAVLIARKGEIKGIVSKSDLFKVILKKR